MKREKILPGKEVQIRCPRLGHQISFAYCRTENSGLPCAKTLDCWSVHFPVADLLRQELSPGEWKKAFERPPKPKILSLVELIAEARHARAG